MESFYGGRPGSSFVIVKHYDCVDTNAYTEDPYKQKYFAVNENKILLSKHIEGTDYPIERTEETFVSYQYQEAYSLTGDHYSAVDVDNHTQTSVYIPEVEKEGMLQDFQRGGETIDIVNYGEYVIIDTLDKNDKDNGKVYRRGMDYSTAPLYGAEYIGQIVGPQGAISDISLVSYDEITEAAASSGEQDLVPGYDGTDYNDKILYKYLDLKDDFDGISTFKVGFKVPYLVNEFEGRTRSAYKDDGTPVDSTVNLIEEIPAEDENEHPFYKHYKIHIPKGIKGDCADNLKAYPTIALETAPYQSSLDANHQPTGTTYNLSSSHAIISREFGTDGINEQDYLVIADNVGYINMKNATPALLELLSEQHLGYLETNYDEHLSGDSRQLDMGPYRIIDHVDMDDSGHITVSYSCGNEDNIGEILRWIYFEGDTPETKGIQMNSDGSITIYYNTLIDESDPTQGRESQTYSNLMTQLEHFNLGNDGILNFKFNNTKLYDNTDTHQDSDSVSPGYQKDYSFEIPQIVRATLNTDTAQTDNCGKFEIVYNNNAVDYDGNPKYNPTTHTYTDRIKQPIDVEIITSGSDTGKIKVHYSNGSTLTTPDPAFKFITGITIENTQYDTTTTPPTPIGDDKFVVHYNFGEDDQIGGSSSRAPINFIERSAFDSVGGDLLVKYTNPASQGSLTYNGIPGWTNLGHVKGDAGGLKPLRSVPSTADLLYGGSIVPVPPAGHSIGDSIKPEEFPTEDYPNGNPQYMGQCILVENPSRAIYYYDYAKNSDNQTLLVNAMSDDSVNPKVVIGTDASYLNDYGIHISSITRKHV